MIGTFPDLSIGRDAANEEGFWPSFTDILTVIVMVFMLAMVVVLLRNLDLVAQLRSTIEAERAASTLAQSVNQEKEGLALRLLETENELAMLRGELDVLRQRSARTEETLARESAALSAERARAETLTRQRDEVSARATTFEQNLAALRTEHLNIQQQLTEQSERATRAQRLADDTRAQLDARSAELVERSEALRLREADLRSVQATLSTRSDEFADLKARYDRLVRPARSAAGKFVVEVQYQRDGEKGTIRYRTADNETLLPATRAELESKLDALKKKHGDALYVRIIFPENSGLSYNEAWQFTRDLLYRYDYYYADGHTDPAPQN